MKRILVTGGNRGIGKEICRQLAGAGHHVFLGSRSLEKGSAAAAELSGLVEVVELDVASAESQARAMGKIGALDVLINNAAIMPGSAGADRVDLAEVRQVFDTNYFGLWGMIQAALPALRKAEDARIISLSSQMGELQSLEGGGYASYRMSKTALNALTILLAADLRSTGIGVHVMCPGWVQTDMGGAGAPRSIEQGADTAVWLATATDLPSGKFWRDRQQIPW